MSTNRAGSALPEIHALFQSGTLAGLTDRELLERFQRPGDAGSERAFAALVDRHGPMVFRTCRAVLADSHDAQDAFQVTFLVLVRKAGTIANRDSVAAWLHGVAYRTASYARGSVARRRKHERAAALREGSSIDPVSRDDLAAILHEEVGRLPERLRAAVLVCEFEGLTLEEGSRRLGCPIGTVKSRLSRARERLRTRLTRRGFGPLAAFPATSPGPPPAALFERTIAAAVLVAGGRSGGVVPAALAAWQAAVLKGIIMSKLRWVALFLAFGLFASGAAILALGQVSKKDSPPTAAKAKTEPSPDQLLAVLARERIAAAKQVRDDLYRLYMGGVVKLTQYYEAQIRYTEAVLAAVDDPETRLTLLRTQLKGVSAIESVTRKLHERGQATRADVSLAEFYRLDAAIRLAEAQTGRKANLKTPLTPELTAETSGQALYESFAKDQATQEVRGLLAKTITVDLPRGATLEDAFKTFKAGSTGPFDSGTPIYVDPAGLARAKVTLQAPVTLPKTTCTLGEAFTKVLEPLGLTYSVKDGLVWVTAK